ncbi:MAG: cobalt ABC transporter permease [Desulfobacterota bacterium]|nr:cobalt ABC transporter permease [Thermodesulfobacteriota bacterium]
MKVQNTMRHLQRFLIVLGLITLFPLLSIASEKWPGVDETVIEKIAQEHGREAKEPLINTDQGDLLLFLFLMAGAIGGFVAGYNWRVLLQDRGEPLTRRNGAIR